MGNLALQTIYPQFDPERPTTPAEDLADGIEGADEAFAIWMGEDDQRGALCDLLAMLSDDPVVIELVSKWSEETKRQA